jgi:hypothetical protein
LSKELAAPMFPVDGRWRQQVTPKRSNFLNYISEDHNSDTVERVEIPRIVMYFLSTIVEYAV